MLQRLTPYILFILIPSSLWIVGTQMRPIIARNFERHIEISDVTPIESIRGSRAGKPVTITERKDTETYTVRRGDSWSSIARSRGLDMTALMDANPKHKANGLKVDDVIVIPASIQER